jgi:protein-tyrosine-phosphatase
MEQTIVFVCEHGAAKSIIAAAYFNKLAKEKNMKVQAFARGTNPDQELAPPALSGLLADGLAVPGERPTLLSQKDIADARALITFCDIPDEYQNPETVEDWSDVPPVSVDYERSRNSILKHIEEFLAKLEKEL